jgi:hypothetical protein
MMTYKPDNMPFLEISVLFSAFNEITLFFFQDDRNDPTPPLWRSAHLPATTRCLFTLAEGKNFLWPDGTLSLAEGDSCVQCGRGAAYCENLCFGNSVDAHFRWEALSEARRRGAEDSSDDETLLELGRKAKAKASQ